MLTIHHLAVSQSERVLWLCEELELEYDVIHYAREATMLAPAEYKALHPLGTAPTITDGAVTVAETGAVFDYILARYGKGRLVEDTSSVSFADYLFWYHFANGTMMPALITAMVLASVGIGKGSSFSEGVIARADLGFDLLEGRLRETRFLAGAHFSAADIMNLFALTTLGKFFPRDLKPFPAVSEYVARMEARPAYHRAQNRAAAPGSR